jgi:hypothetical protein
MGIALASKRKLLPAFLAETARYGTQWTWSSTRLPIRSDVGVASRPDHAVLPCEQPCILAFRWQPAYRNLYFGTSEKQLYEFACAHPAILPEDAMSRVRTQGLLASENSNIISLLFLFYQYHKMPPTISVRTPKTQRDVSRLAFTLLYTLL